MKPQFHIYRRRGPHFVAPSLIIVVTAIIFLLGPMKSSASPEQQQQAHVTTTSDTRQISKRHTSEKDFAPKLIHQPQSVLVQPNKPHTIECPVEAKPEAEVKWFKDRQLLVSQPAHLEQTGSELMFFQVNDDDTGDYYCQATNHLGSIESENFRITVQSSIHDPRIGLEPRLAEVGADQQVEFTCSILSATTTTSRQKSQQRGASQQRAQQQSPEVGWRRNGKRLEVKWLDEGEELREARSRFVARQAGPSEFVLTITRTQLKDDNATFTCLFTPEQAQAHDGTGFEPEAADSSLSSSSDSSGDEQLAHESSPAKLRVYALDHRQQPANVATPDGHVKLDVNLALPIDNLISNRPHELHEQPSAAANHTTQLSHQHPRSRTNTTLKQTLEDLYEISKPLLVICGIALLVIVGPALLYISRRTSHQNRYMKHHQFNGCGGGSAGSSGPGSGASSAIGALGTIDCHDPVLNSLMARTLSAPNGSAASLAGGGPAAVAAALNGKKYRSYRDHMRKVAVANEAAAAVGCNDLVDGYFAAAVAAAAAAQQQQHPTTVGDHNSAVAAAAAANSLFAAANSAAALPNLYNQSLAAREQARSLLQASEHMRSLSNLSHVASQQKYQQQQQHSRLGQNGSHLNLPLSFAFGNPVTTSNVGGNNNNSQTTGRPNGEQASSTAPGAARLIDGAAQLMASALWPPHLAHFASGRGANHHLQQRQATAGLLPSCQPSCTLQSDEHYQLVNCSSISPSSSSSIVGSNSSSNPRDSRLRLQGARDSTSLNHYSTIENNEDDEDRYEEVDHNQNTCDSANNHNNTSNSRHLQAQRASDTANAQRQESFRISQTSTFGSNNGGGNLVADQQQRHIDGNQNQKPSSLRSSFISSSNSSSSGCGDSTNTSSSLASEAFSRFGLKQRSNRQNQTRSGRQQNPNDQLSPYAVSSICGSVPQAQVPPPPMSSDAMRALHEQFDINQLMLLDESATMTDDNNHDGLIGFNAPPPPPTDNSTVDSNHKANKEENLRSQADRRKLIHDQQQ